MKKIFILTAVLMGFQNLIVAQPYLELTGGTLTGGLAGTSATFSDNITIGNGSVSERLVNIDGQTYSGVKLKRAGTEKWAIFNNNAGTDYLDFYWYGSSPGTKVSVTPAGNLAVAGTGTFGGTLTGMSATFSGNVGLGTSSPSYQHTIENPTGNYFASSLLSGSIGTPGNWVGQLFGYTGNTYQKGAVIYEGSDSYGRGKMHIALNGTANSSNVSLSDAMLTMDYTGNVGIGTTSPSEKLAVNGKIRAKEVKVETSWSDFVFEPTYKLRTLKETEKFIKENKHLPEIPSAKEVLESGINLGEMNSKLLQKIEELTLHLIEKDKQFSDLQERMQKLEKQK